MPPLEQEIGIIDRYYTRQHLAGIYVENGRLKVGDRIRIKGQETEWEETVHSMQVESVDVREVGRGAHVGVPLRHKVHARDRVFVIHP